MKGKQFAQEWRIDNGRRIEKEKKKNNMGYKQVVNNISQMAVGFDINK